MYHRNESLFPNVAKCGNVLMKSHDNAFFTFCFKIFMLATNFQTENKRIANFSTFAFWFIVRNKIKKEFPAFLAKCRDKCAILQNMLCVIQFLVGKFISVAILITFLHGSFFLALCKLISSFIRIIKRIISAFSMQFYITVEFLNKWKMCRCWM